MELKFTKQYPHLLSTDNGRCGPKGLRNFWTVILFSFKYALISQILYSIIKLFKGFLGPSPGLYMWQHWISIYWINAWKNSDINNITFLFILLSMLSFLLYIKVILWKLPQFQTLLPTNTHAPIHLYCLLPNSMETVPVFSHC